MSTTPIAHYTQKVFSFLENLPTPLRLDARRIMCLAMMIVAVIMAQSVNLAKMTLYTASTKKDSSLYRRFQRFISEVRLPQASIADMIIKMLNISENNKARIAIDRTEWRFGDTWHNVFTGSIMAFNVTIPFMWADIAKKGASSDEERLSFFDTMFQFIRPQWIEFIAMDREFASFKVFDKLRKHKVPFVSRLKSNTRIIHFGKTFSADSFGLYLNEGEHLKIARKVLIYGFPLYFTVLKIANGEFLLLATSHKPSDALERYAERWQIECAFKALKTHGFNLEDTHIKNKDRLETLMGVLVLAYVFAYKMGVFKAKKSPIEIKNHGRSQYSIITYGLRDFVKMLTAPIGTFCVPDGLFSLMSCT
jgi:hypothetical protein